MEYNLFISESLEGKYGICSLNTYWKKFKSNEERTNYIEELKKAYDLVKFYANEINNNCDCTYINIDKYNLTEAFSYIKE